MHDVSQRIVDIYDELTRSERRMADTILQAPDLVAELSATSLAARAGVSKATAARFFRRLGYAGARVARADARRSIDRDGREPEWRARFGTPRVSQAQHLTAEVQNLTRTIEQIRSDDLDSAIRAFALAEKIWVVGFGENYPLAHFARALLIRVKPDIRMIPIGGFSVPEEFASIRASDAVLALGVGRRTKSLRSVMASSRKADAHVTFITDQIAPVSEDAASVTLRCRTKGAGAFDSVVAPVSVLTYFCSSLALRIGEPALARLEYISQIHAEWAELAGDDF
ncbi:MurR/RpiR family transcriptional regulator [Mangrovicoccus sp. HB161399]|uniref:MurR/RpiR family transcriptional regulator n=1 Tax=Mangrovicoccus sp. HB161399 TaxID=2720392 RepID=UPI00155366DA|nr:MurR/RpiR family transcriptional regulator [Mangrovicoccus sp. HB161399]